MGSPSNAPRRQVCEVLTNDRSGGLKAARQKSGGREQELPLVHARRAKGLRFQKVRRLLESRKATDKCGRDRQPISQELKRFLGTPSNDPFAGGGARYRALCPVSDSNRVVPG
jgi:hypothetical protein